MTGESAMGRTPGLAGGTNGIVRAVRGSVVDVQFDHGVLPALPDVRGRPLVNLPLAELADAVLSEWVLGELVHAVVETLASENGARLLAMDAARSNVESKLVVLRGAYRVARQEAITSEIAEVVGGVLAQEQT
jgi:F-type H+-transporting ATPase subunit gamma